MLVGMVDKACKAKVTHLGREGAVEEGVVVDTKMLLLDPGNYGGDSLNQGGGAPAK